MKQQPVRTKILIKIAGKKKFIISNVDQEKENSFLQLQEMIDIKIKEKQTSNKKIEEYGQQRSWMKN